MVSRKGGENNKEKEEAGAKPWSAPKHNLNCEKPWGSWPVVHRGLTSVQWCWTGKTSILPLAPSAPAVLAQDRGAGHQPQVRLEAKMGKGKHAGEFMGVFDRILMTLTSDGVPGLSVCLKEKAILGCGGLLWS